MSDNGDRMQKPVDVQPAATGLVPALAAGLILHIAWLFGDRGLTSFVEAGEATRVALSLAAGTGFSDAFFPGQGPTAHMLPVMAWIAGSIFVLFGSGTALANLLLMAWALLQTFAGYLLLRRLFGALGASPAALRLGMILLCFLPVYVAQEMIDFRYWEGALAVCLAAGSLLLLLRLERKPALAATDLMLVAILSAITFFISPPTGLALDACWVVFAVRRGSARDALRLASLALLALAVLIVPWTLRNQHQLGMPVMLRSNFGLELAIGNYPGALAQPPSVATLKHRLTAIHPYHSAAAANALRAAGGEVRYANALGTTTERWILANPADFLGLCLRHYGQFFFPQPWQMNFTEFNRFRIARAVIISTIDLLGLLGLAWGLWRRRRGYWLLATYVGLTSLPYALVQPVPRYTYLVYGMLAFLAAQLLVEAAGYSVRRSSPPGARWLR